MKILAMVSQKGGVGKSLLSAHLAVAFEEAGIATVAIDLDPQASLIRWAEDRKADEPTVVAGLVTRLPGMLKKAREADIDLVIIDTPPHSDKNALGAIAAADLILVPTRPAIFDLRSIGDTINIVKLARKERQAMIILNAVPVRGKVTADAEAFAKGYGVEIAPVRVADRAPLSDALVGGQGITEYEPKGKAAGDIRALCTFLAKHLELPLRSK